MYESFAAALSADDPAPPPGLTAWNGAAERRFGVYRNNVRVGLTGALASRFPVTETIVGEDFFRAMAAAFIEMHPPRSPLLLAYGDDLPAFIDGFAPAQGLPYLADVARLEAARSRAYHAADAAPLAAEAFAAAPAERLGDVRLAPHPSLTLVRSAFPVVTIWAMNAGETPLAEIDDWTGEDAMICRPEMLVEVRALPPGGAVFLDALAAGETLGAAAHLAMTDAADFDLPGNLAGLLSSGAFTALLPLDA